MVVTTEHERTLNAGTSYLACFKGGDLQRTLIAMGTYCAQTLSGNPLRAFSTYFLQQAGFPSDQAFNMTIINHSLALIGGFVSVSFPPRPPFSELHVLSSLDRMSDFYHLPSGLSCPCSAGATCTSGVLSQCSS